MLEKFIKKDKNEELEKILEEKKIEEHAKNLLQGILYKIEVSYKDYKKAKAIKTTEREYIEELLRDIQRNCNKINIIKPSETIGDKKVQAGLEKKQYYINNDEIYVYPIETKLLYAIEKISNNKKIVNQKYGITSITLSEMINTGKCIDRIEVLKDFNGWSWTTIKSEMENITANLIYQTLQILLSKEFMNSWNADTDGIIDYVAIMKKELTQKYDEQTATEIIHLLNQISIINYAEESKANKEYLKTELEKIEQKIQEYEDKKSYINKYTEMKKQATKEIVEIEKILSQESKLKQEYDKRNEGVAIDQKIFSVRVLKQQLIDKKNMLLAEIEESNYYLNPENYISEKEETYKQKELLEVYDYTKIKKHQLVVQLETIVLNCFEKEIETSDEEKLIQLIYQFRYFMLIPFNNNQNVKDIAKLKKTTQHIEQQLISKAIASKVITRIPSEITDNLLKTRIVNLEELYFKITKEEEEYYVQIFDENISEEKFKIEPAESKIKLNKKIKIFN